MTDSQTNAINWLRQHGGDGLFDRNGVLVAAGERAPFMRLTWNALSELGFVEFYKPGGKGGGRCRLLPKADSVPEVSRHVIQSLQDIMQPEEFEQEEEEA